MARENRSEYGPGHNARAVAYDKFALRPAVEKIDVFTRFRPKRLFVYTTRVRR